MPTLTYPSGRKATKQDRSEALERLREWLKDGDTLWFILRHRAASGMQRVYDVKQLTVDTSERSAIRSGDRNVVSVATLSWTIASACDFAWNESHQGIKINGCGFSGEQEIADTVGRLLGIKLRYETL